MEDKIFWTFEPIGYLEDMERQVKELEEGEGRIFQPYLGRSVWEYVVEDLTKIMEDLGDVKGERTRLLRNRILRMM